MVRPAFVQPTFDQVHAESFAAVWRLARRLGVAESSIDDLIQEVYLVVYRRLDQFTGESAVKTWVLGIAVRVVGNYRRSRRRKGAAHALTSPVVDPELLESTELDPHEQLSRVEAAGIVQRLLSEMDVEKATLFILAELEELTVPEIALALGKNVNTTYVHLAAARRAFEGGLRKLRRRYRW